MFLSLFSCGEKAPSPVALAENQGGLGRIEIEVTGSEEAREDFIRGLLLLHSFEYKDAREAFQQAREKDQDFVMAYWGEAMTHNHPLWRGQEIEKARAVLEMLGPDSEARIGKAQTSLEKDLMAAVELLYGEGEKQDRDVLYRDFMEELHDKYPGNHEVSAFYALSILGSVPVGRDDAMYEKGARVALSILAENPEHPGALHYTIHSYDDPGHAHLAKAVADRYSQVAPDAAHALHMPSHIYVALGAWDDVVRSNIAAWNASVDRMKQKDLGQDAVNYHSLHWLLYGYLQKENMLMADSIMSSMKRYVEISPSINARSYMIEMMGNYLAETGKWEHPISNYEVDLDSLNILDQSIYHYINGMRDASLGIPDLVHMKAEQMRREIERAELFVTEEGLPLCSSSSLYLLPNRLDLDQSRVLELLLRARLAVLQGDPVAAESWMQEAIALDEGLSYSYGPPVIIVPPQEMYGQWLIEKGRYSEAVQMLEKALKKGPGRRIPLKLQDQLSQETSTAKDETRLKDQDEGNKLDQKNTFGEPFLY
jgi:tetratricopeptide (TPR) repeat protein